MKVEEEDGKAKPVVRKSAVAVAKESVFKWWEQKVKLPPGDKWASMEHNGVTFPPAYEPHGVKMRCARCSSSVP